MTMKKLLIIALVIAMAAGAQAACNDCVLQVDAVSNSICQGDSATYDITITNVYAQPKAISLTASGDIALTSDLPSQITVDAYATKTVRVSFTPVQYILGQHRINIEASGYGADDSDDAIFVINDCYIADLQLMQQSVELCQDSVARVDYTLTNNGQKQDTYDISVTGIPDVLEVSFSGGPITLAPGASRTGSITVKALGKEYGTYTLTLNMVSQAKTFSKSFDAVLKNCYYVSVTAPEDFVSCPDAGLTYTVRVKNNGCVADNYALSLSGTCRASLVADSIRVESGETAEVAVTLDSVFGECDLTFSASSKYDSDSATTHVKLMECYGVDLDLLPDNTVSACRGEPVKFTAKVTNTGYYADNYTLRLEGIPINLSKTSMSLESGASDTAYFTVIGTWCVIKDEIPFAVIVIGQASVPGAAGLASVPGSSGHASDAENGLLKFKPTGAACADLELTPEQTPLQMDCEGGAYNFYVKNTGYTTQEVTLGLQGLDYLVQPSQLALKPGESRPAAVYLTSPPQDDFPVTIVADSEYGRAYLELKADFTGPVCIVSRPSLEVPEQPLLPLIVEEPEEQNETIQYMTPTGGAVGGLSSPMLIAIFLTLTALALLVALLLVTRKGGKEGAYFSEVRPTSRQATEAERLAAIKEAISQTSK